TCNSVRRNRECVSVGIGQTRQPDILIERILRPICRRQNELCRVICGGVEGHKVSRTGCDSTKEHTSTVGWNKLRSKRGAVAWQLTKAQGWRRDWPERLALRCSGRCERVRFSVRKRYCHCRVSIRLQAITWELPAELCRL